MVLLSAIFALLGTGCYFVRQVSESGDRRLRTLFSNLLQAIVDRPIDEAPYLAVRFFFEAVLRVNGILSNGVDWLMGFRARDTLYPSRMGALVGIIFFGIAFCVLLVRLEAGVEARPVDISVAGALAVIAPLSALVALLVRVRYSRGSAAPSEPSSVTEDLPVFGATTSDRTEVLDRSAVEPLAETEHRFGLNEFEALGPTDIAAFVLSTTAFLSAAIVCVCFLVLPYWLSTLAALPPRQTTWVLSVLGGVSLLGASSLASVQRARAAGLADGSASRPIEAFSFPMKTVLLYTFSICFICSPFILIDTIVRLPVPLALTTFALSQPLMFIWMFGFCVFGAAVVGIITRRPTLRYVPLVVGWTSVTFVITVAFYLVGTEIDGPLFPLTTRLLLANGACDFLTMLATVLTIEALAQERSFPIIAAWLIGDTLLTLALSFASLYFSLLGTPYELRPVNALASLIGLDNSFQHVKLGLNFLIMHTAAIPTVFYFLMIAVLFLFAGFTRLLVPVLRYLNLHRGPLDLMGTFLCLIGALLAVLATIRGR